MDEIHFAPPKKPWKNDPPVHTNEQWFPMISKRCEMDFVHPQRFFRGRRVGLARPALRLGEQQVLPLQLPHVVGRMQDVFCLLLFCLLLFFHIFFSPGGTCVPIKRPGKDLTRFGSSKAYRILGHARSNTALSQV